jgi:hypothetical protein
MEALQQILADFVDAAKRHHASTNQGEYPEANYQAQRLRESFRKLVMFGDIGRDLLVELQNHDRDEVALMAAAYSLKGRTDTSLATLERLQKKPGLLAFSAQQTIARWMEGAWKLED